MKVSSAIKIIKRNLITSKAHLFFSTIGLMVGTATLSFFLGLSNGIRENVLNRLYPVNQVEFQEETVRLFGFGIDVPVVLDKATIKALSNLKGVVGVYPKQRSKFPARLWGGREVFGYEARLEAFFDGIAPELVTEELRSAEEIALGPVKIWGGCKSDQDCGEHAVCEDGKCRRKTYWDAFRDHGGAVACKSDKNCPSGMVCLKGLCSVPCGDTCSGACVNGECLKLCDKDKDCMLGEVCLDFDGRKACKRLSCTLDDPKDQFTGDLERVRGRIQPMKGVEMETCPQGTYCAAFSVVRKDGVCEAPIPVLLSPFILEIYNTVAVTALDLKRLAGPEVMLGIEFSMLYGESYFVEDEEIELRAVKRCKIVGFSRKAMEFGVTAPLPYVIRANSALRGREEADEYTSVIVETERNEDVPPLIEDARVLGLTLAPRSEEGRKAAYVLHILTIVFAMVSIVILTIASINITHTFLMLISERRMEIGIYRAVGASLLDIKSIIMGEALLLGIFGGGIGLILGYLISRGMNVLVSAFLVRQAPKDLFVFSWDVVLMGFGMAILFTLIGAFIPARRAAMTDPAKVLSQG